MKAEFKKAVKDMMKNYKFSLEQAVWSIRQMNPDYEMLMNDVELSLIEDELMGRL